MTATPKSQAGDQIPPALQPERGDPAPTNAPGDHPIHPAHSRRRLLLRLARPVVSIAAVILIVKFLLLKALNENRTNFRHLVHINAAYLVLGVGLEVASLLVYARLTQAVLPRNGQGTPAREVGSAVMGGDTSARARYGGPSIDGRPSFFTLLRIDMSTFALSHLVPGGSVAGAALGYRLLDAEGISYTDATFALGTQSIGSAVVLNIIFWGALIVSIPLHGVTHNIGYLYRAAAIVGALVMALAGGLIFFLTSGREWAGRAIHKIALKVPLINAGKVEQAVHTLAEHLASLARDWRLLMRAIVWAAANWALDAASLWVFLLGFGVNTLAPYLLVAYGLAYVLAAIPITPAGLGVVETLLIVVLKGFGYTSPGVGLGVLSYRVVNFLLPIPFGGASYLSLTLHRAVTDHRRHALKTLRRAEKDRAPSAAQDPLRDVAEDHHRRPPAAP